MHFIWRIPVRLYIYESCCGSKCSQVALRCFKAWTVTTAWLDLGSWRLDWQQDKMLFFLSSDRLEFTYHVFEYNKWIQMNTNEYKWLNSNWLSECRLVCLLHSIPIYSNSRGFKKFKPQLQQLLPNSVQSWTWSCSPGWSSEALKQWEMAKDKFCRAHDTRFHMVPECLKYTI